MAGPCSGVKAPSEYARLVALGCRRRGRGHRRARVRGTALRDRALLRIGRRYAFVVLVAAVVVAGRDGVGADRATTSRCGTSPRTTPVDALLSTITGLWAALEGSILLWGPCRAGTPRTSRTGSATRASDPARHVGPTLGVGVALFFFVLMLGPANPFRTLPITAAPTVAAPTRCSRTIR